MIIVSQINPKALEVLNGNIKMSISSEIQRLQEAKKSINIALLRRGIHIPSGDTLDKYAALIDPITSGETIVYLDNPQGYLSFKFVTDGTVKWQNVKGDIEYSKNGGSTWTAFNGATVSATTGDEIWFKGSLTGGCGANAETRSSKFYTSGYFFASGNIQSLCGFYNTLQDYHFSYLFFKCSFLNIDENNKLLLPATKLANNCYGYMFRGCASLTTAPKLPATTLANYCYESMFQDCTSLTTAPELPATTLADSCYSYMFQGCASLTTAPELPATTLANNCYGYMFQGCTSLTTAPELPATTLANNCYYSMFQGCTSLTTAPELPATTLANYCYESMFRGCTSLTTAPELPATTLANNCYYSMFQGCTSLTTAPELPATTLANYCYSSMFQGCASLTTAPKLPVTTLANYCYESMFRECTSLTTAPELPATTLANRCYYSIFRDCTSLNYIKAMFTTTPSTSYMSNWVNGVASSGTFVKNSAATWTSECGVSTYPCNWAVETASA